jgi:hypothetical protein
MQVIENNLFTQISTEESANVNGGNTSSIMNLLSAGAVSSVLNAFDLDDSEIGQTFILFTLAGGFSF